MSKKGGSTPDPYATAAAQTTSNQNTAEYNAALNRVNQYTPYGSSVYSQNGTDSSGAPIYNQTTTLSPLAQQQLDNQMKQDAGLSNLGYGLADQAGSALSKPLDTSGLPALSGAPTAGAISNSLGDTGKIQTGLDYSGVSKMYGSDDFNAANQRTADAAYKQATSRLDPQWENTQNQNDAKLANQGVLFGTGAYGKAQTQLDQAKNDAYNQANYSSIAAGNAEQASLFNQSLSARQQGVSEVNNQGAFANAAQAQQYAQALSSGNFANSAQAQAYSQGTSGAQLNNQARAQGLTEATSLRDLPLNELNALRSSTQISNPQFSAVPQSTAAGTDISGDIYKSAQLDAANSNNFMNGLFSLGGAAITKYSDRRLKRDIILIGETPVMKLPLYSYRYLWDDAPQIGVMAQDVAEVMPSAIVLWGDYMAVDYSALS